MPGLRRVIDDQQLAVLRILADRRRSLGEDHTRMISQLHQLLLELIPGGAKKDLSAAQAKALLARVRPRDAAGKARRRVAAELISDLERIYQRKKAANKELTALLAATGTTLTDLHGIGPSGAARLLVEVGDVTRFPSRAHFASWNGTAPIDASSGDQVRHRLSRAGQPADQPGAAHHGRGPAPQPHPRPRLLRPQSRRREDTRGSDARPQTPALRHRLPPDDQRRPGTGERAREDTWGRLLAPARPACTPAPALRRSHFPDPPPATLCQESQSIHLGVPGAFHQRRTAAAVKRTLLDDGEDRSTLSRPGMTPLDTEGSHDSVWHSPPERPHLLAGANLGPRSVTAGRAAGTGAPQAGSGGPARSQFWSHSCWCTGVDEGPWLPGEQRRQTSMYLHGRWSLILKSGRSAVRPRP